MWNRVRLLVLQKRNKRSKFNPPELESSPGAGSAPGFKMFFVSILKTRNLDSFVTCYYTRSNKVEMSNNLMGEWNAFDEDRRPLKQSAVRWHHERFSAFITMRSNDINY